MGSHQVVPPPSVVSKHIPHYMECKYGIYSGGFISISRESFNEDLWAVLWFAIDGGSQRKVEYCGRLGIDGRWSGNIQISRLGCPANLYEENIKHRLREVGFWISDDVYQGIYAPLLQELHEIYSCVVPN